jgi:hypothetical protein
MSERKTFHQTAIDKLHEHLATAVALAQAAQEGAAVHLLSQTVAVAAAETEADSGATGNITT